MTTLSIQEWTNGFEDAGFSNVELYKYGAKENWTGTLVIVAQKQETHNLLIFQRAAAPYMLYNCK